jgi:capsular polysaccharide biosynthesis protein
LTPRQASEPNPDTDELAIGALVRRWIWLLLAFGTVGALAALTIVSGRESIYEADSRVLIGPINASPDAIDAAGSLTRTYSQLVESRALVDAAAAAADLAPRDVEVRAIPNPETRVLLITVRGHDRLRTPQVANALVDLLALRVNEADRSPASGDVQVIDDARSPAPKVDAGPVLVIATGSAAGGIAGVAVAVVLERARRRGRQPANQLDEGTFLGQLRMSLADRHLRRWPDRITGAPNSKRTVEHRLAMARLRLATGGGPQCFVLVPVDSSQGLALSALDLATVEALDGGKVVLIDADCGTITAATADADRLKRQRVVRFPNGGSLRILPVIGEGHFDPGSIQLVLDRLADGGLVLIYCRPARTSPEGLAWIAAVRRAVLLVPTSGYQDDFNETLAEIRLAGAEVTGTITVRGPRTPFGIGVLAPDPQPTDAWTPADLAGLNGAAAPPRPTVAGPARSRKRSRPKGQRR